jgi:hypothetical protein
MGQQLADIYTIIQNEGGMRARMRLTMMTGLPSQKAVETADTEELVEKFRSSYKEIMLKECPLRQKLPGGNTHA